MTTPEELADDFAAAIKAADDYADALNQLGTHDLTDRTRAWLTAELDHVNDSLLALRLDADLHGRLT